jgi:hypothetical protein
MGVSLTGSNVVHIQRRLKAILVGEFSKSGWENGDVRPGNMAFHDEPG